MATMTLQIPTAQIGWFEQMVRTMGWTFTRKDVVEEDVRSEITPALRRRINKARKESERGETALEKKHGRTADAAVSGASGQPRLPEKHGGHRCGRRCAACQRIRPDRR